LFKLGKRVNVIKLIPLFEKNYSMLFLKNLNSVRKFNLKVSNNLRKELDNLICVIDFISKHYFVLKCLFNYVKWFSNFVELVE